MVIAGINALAAAISADWPVPFRSSYRFVGKGKQVGGRRLTLSTENAGTKKTPGSFAARRCEVDSDGTR